jgi:hypothetical protein
MIQNTTKESNSTNHNEVLGNNTKFIFNSVIASHFNKYFYFLQIKTWILSKRIILFFNRFNNIFSIAIILVIPIFIFSISHYWNLGSIRSSLLANIFIAIGAMIGGALAIVFSLGVFAQQNASYLYSSQFFGKYAHDKIEIIIYIAIVTIIIFHFLGGIVLYLGEYTSTAFKIIAIYCSLTSIGIIFFWINLLYNKVRSKANPMTALIFLEGQSISYLEKLHKDVNRFAALLKLSNENISGQMAVATVYNDFATTPLDNLDQQIENLFEISLKLSERQEIRTTNRALSVVHNILLKFMELRKDSSFVKISNVSIFAIESDSQNFLSKSLQRLNNMGEYFIRSKKIDNAVFIIYIFESLAIKSKNIIFINREFDNPTFDQIKGYYYSFLQSAVREKDTEIVFQGAKVLNTLSSIAIEKGLNTSLSGIQDYLLEIALYGITNNKVFIVDICNNAWIGSINSIFRYRFYEPEYAIKETLDNVITVTTYMHSSISSRIIPDDIVTNMNIGKPYDNLMFSISTIMDSFKELNDAKSNSYYRNTLIILFTEIRKSLRKMAENIKISDALLFTYLGRLLDYTTGLILHLSTIDEFREQKHELEELLAWYIHLPYWFLHYSNGIEKLHNFETLLDIPAKTGIILISNHHQSKQIIDCVDAIYSMVRTLLNKLPKGYGSEELRLMKKMVYLGILAYKNNDRDLFTEIGIKIYEFEDIYNLKYGSHQKSANSENKNNKKYIFRDEELASAIFRWRFDFSREKYSHHRAIDDSKNKMYGIISEIDIDRFLYEVWGIIPANSPIRKEIEEKHRKSFILNIIRIINVYISKAH